MTDVSAKVTLGWWMDAGDRKLPDLSAMFTDGVRLELAGLPRSRAPVRPPTGWAKGERFGAPAKLILKSASEVQQISSNCPCREDLSPVPLASPHASGNGMRTSGAW